MNSDNVQEIEIPEEFVKSSNVEAEKYSSKLYGGQRLQDADNSGISNTSFIAGARWAYRHLHPLEGEKKPFMVADEENMTDFEKAYTYAQGMIDHAPFKDVPYWKGYLAGLNFVLDHTDEPWISVKDGLPEIGHPVLVFTEFEDRGKPKDEMFTGYMDEQGDLLVFPSDEDYGWKFKECVTYWRPIPTHPPLIEVPNKRTNTENHE